jgi:hypothetical protein
MDSEHELIQLTERALADAEEALRADPTEANPRRVLKAWSAVTRAREHQRPQDARQSPSPQPPFAG